MPLEANAQGTPVVYYGSGGLSETQVEGTQWTGVSFKELSVTSVKETLTEFMAIEHSVDGKFCRDNATRFSVQIFRENMKKLVTSYA